MRPCWRPRTSVGGCPDYELLYLSRPNRQYGFVTSGPRQEDELAMHLRAAIRNGLTPEQIREVLLQVGVYAGVPAANRAFAVAQDVLVTLAEEGNAQSS